MDNDTYKDNASVRNSSNRTNIERNTAAQAAAENKDLGDFLDFLTLGCQTKRPEIDTSAIQTRPPSSKRPSSCSEKYYLQSEAKKCLQCKDTSEPYCHIKLDSIVKLKESTRKLLCLLEEIQSKTHSKNIIQNDTPNLSNILKPIPPTNSLPSVTDLIGAGALSKLEIKAKTLDAIYIQDEDDDCSIYKRLTRKCHCLNQHEYNDFIIHFNEDTKYFTSDIGEIIKNMRILKKFLYMNGGYTNRALMFLNEGLQEASHCEKVEIIQGCAYADICNVFDDHSIIIICISWPCKYDTFGDVVTQALTAELLYKLAQLEEGRRYLNFSSKITNDIKKVIRKKASKLEFDTIDTLNSTLNLLNPPLAQHVNITYYCKPVDQAIGNKTVNALIHYREYMTLDEVFAHLDMLRNLSKNDTGKKQLTLSLPAILNLFKHMLTEYDNSEMNIIVTNILNNIVSKNLVKEKEPVLIKTMIIADTATEPIKTKNGFNQIPLRKNNRKNNKSKLGLGLSPNKHRQTSLRKVSHWEPSGLLNKSRKFSKDIRSSVIVVPIEKSL